LDCTSNRAWIIGLAGDRPLEGLRTAGQRASRRDDRVRLREKMVLLMAVVSRDYRMLVDDAAFPSNADEQQ
jgi:hypothetical protein